MIQAHYNFDVCFNALVLGDKSRAFRGGVLREAARLAVVRIGFDLYSLYVIHCNRNTFCVSFDVCVR